MAVSAHIQARSRRRWSSGCRRHGVTHFIALLAVAGAATVAVAQSDRFAERVTVLEVQVPVNVTSHGEAVRGLTREDFIVLEGRKQLPIVDFEEVDLAVRAAGVSEPVPVAARRHFLFLFDLVHSEPQGLLLARQAALGLVQRGMHSSDLAGVATNGARGIEVLLGFTSDREQLALALESLGAPQLVERHSDPLLLSLGIPTRALGDTSTAVSSERSARRDSIEAMVQSHLQKMGMVEAVANRLAQANRAGDLVRSFAGLGRALAEADGRKYVILFSEGFDGKLLTGVSSPPAGERRDQIEIREAEVRDPNLLFSQTQLRSGMERMLEELRRSDTVVQSVDVGRLRASGRGAGEEVLLLIASDTGGELFSNYNDLDAAMVQLSARTAVTYLLSVRVDATPGDRRFHQLKVRLTGGRRGAEIRHRAGYYPPPIGQEDVGTARLKAAQRILGGQPGGVLPASVLAVALPALEGAAAVPVLVDIEGSALAGEDDQRGGAFLEIYAYAFDRQGKVVAFFTKTLGLDLGKLGATLGAGGGIRFVGQLQLPPGEHSLRVLVREPLGGASRLEVRRIEVPDSPVEPVLIGPFVEDHRPGWVRIDDGGPDNSDPFAMGRPGALPAVRPALPASGRTAVVLLASGVSSGPLRLEGALKDSTGAPALGGSVEAGDCVATGDPAVRCHAWVLTEGMPPATYRLSVQLRNDLSRPLGNAELSLWVE